MTDRDEALTPETDAIIESMARDPIGSFINAISIARKLEKQRNQISELLCVAHDYILPHYDMRSAPLHLIDDFVKGYINENKI